MQLSGASVLQHNPERVWRQYLKGVVVEPGVALNETASALFVKIDGKRTLDDICRQMLEEFDVDLETLLQDGIEVANDLVEQGIVLVR